MSKKPALSKTPNTLKPKHVDINSAFNNQIIVKNPRTGEFAPIGKKFLNNKIIVNINKDNKLKRLY